MTDVTISRRNILGAAVAASAMQVAPSHAATRTLDPVKDLGLITRKLHLRADDGVVFWWLVGTKIGQINAVATPLFGMEVGSIMRVVHKPDGGYDLTTLEIVFYTDINTGEWLRKWRNPYTGVTLDVNHGPLGPGTLSYTADGDRAAPRRELGGAIIEGSTRPGPAMVAGNDVWVRWDNTSKVTQKDGSGRPFLVNDWVTVHGSAADILNPARPFIAATSELHEITSWSKWLDMGDRDGNTAARAVGAKVRSYAEMPTKWRSLIAQAHPDVAKDPIGALDKPAARLDR